MASKSPSVAGQGLGLITDLLNGLRQEIRGRGWDESTTFERLRETAVIVKIADLLRSTLEFVDRTVQIVMHGAMDLGRLIQIGNYDWVNPYIQKYWKLSVAQTSLGGEAILLHYNKYMTSEQVLADMERQGLRPGTDRELLELGAQHPDLQKEFPVVGLGTVVLVGVNRHVLYLHRLDRGRDLGLYWFDSDWSGAYRFLAFRK